MHRGHIEAMPLADLKVYLGVLVEDPDDFTAFWHAVLTAAGVVS